MVLKEYQQDEEIVCKLCYDEDNLQMNLNLLRTSTYEVYEIKSITPVGNDRDQRYLLIYTEKEI